MAGAGRVAGRLLGHEIAGEGRVPATRVIEEDHSGRRRLDRRAATLRPRMAYSVGARNRS